MKLSKKQKIWIIVAILLALAAPFATIFLSPVISSIGSENDPNTILNVGPLWPFGGLYLGGLMLLTSVLIILIALTIKRK